MIRSLLCLLLAASTLAAQKPKFTVGWSIYVGWNPYAYMEKSGILKKWADKYGVEIKVQRFDYAPSLDAFVAKNIDACTMTNMEALDMPAAAGVDTTSIITGDYSNGNDAVLVRNGLTFPKLQGKKVMLVEKTVSQYLFERGMTINGQKDQLKRVPLVNTSDSDIATAFIANPSQEAVVTWKPMVSQILKTKGVTSIFNSSQIPGEILDLLVVRTDVLKRPEGQKFAKAITGAWYEVTSQMKQDKILAAIAQNAQDTLPSYKEQPDHHKSLLHAAIRRCLHPGCRPQTEDGTGSPVLLRAPSAGRRQNGGPGRDCLSRWIHPRQAGARALPLRYYVYANGGTGQIISGVVRHQCPPKPHCVLGPVLVPVRSRHRRLSLGRESAAQREP